MLDFSHIPTPYGASDVQEFIGTAAGNIADFQTWVKPRGKTMAHLLLFGPGGNGGVGAIGANSTAAGGGGGGSGGQITMIFPLWAVPDTLFLYLARGGGLNAGAVYVAPVVMTNNCFAYAERGSAGGNASGATAGAAGGAGGATISNNMPLGWQWTDVVVAGQAGIIGGVAVSGAALTVPGGGLMVTGGTGGGGLPASAAAGTNGGSFTVAGIFASAPHPGGLGATLATTPSGNGTHGGRPVAGLNFGFGGTGGGSTHGSATGAGLVQASGGNGFPGCGGGGSGGALTGSTAGAVGVGGPARCVITCW